MFRLRSGSAAGCGRWLGAACGRFTPPPGLPLGRSSSPSSYCSAVPLEYEFRLRNSVTSDSHHASTHSLAHQIRIRLSGCGHASWRWPGVWRGHTVTHLDGVSVAGLLSSDHGRLGDADDLRRPFLDVSDRLESATARQCRAWLGGVRAAQRRPAVARASPTCRSTPTPRGC